MGSGRRAGRVLAVVASLGAACGCGISLDLDPVAPQATHLFDAGRAALDAGSRDAAALDAGARDGGAVDDDAGTADTCDPTLVAKPWIDPARRVAAPADCTPTTAVRSNLVVWISDGVPVGAHIVVSVYDGATGALAAIGDAATPGDLPVTLRNLLEPCGGYAVVVLLDLGGMPGVCDAADQVIVTSTTGPPDFATNVIISPSSVSGVDLGGCPCFAVPGDLDSDGCLTDLDVCLFAAEASASTHDPRADIDADGAVDPNDLSLMVERLRSSGGTSVCGGCAGGP